MRQRFSGRGGLGGEGTVATRSKKSSTNVLESVLFIILVLLSFNLYGCKAKKVKSNTQSVSEGKAIKERTLEECPNEAPVVYDNKINSSSLSLTGEQVSLESFIYPDGSKGPQLVFSPDATYVRLYFRLVNEQGVSWPEGSTASYKTWAETYDGTSYLDLPSSFSGKKANLEVYSCAYIAGSQDLNCVETLKKKIMISTFALSKEAKLFISQQKQLDEKIKTAGEKFQRVAKEYVERMPSEPSALSYQQMIAIAQNMSQMDGATLGLIAYSGQDDFKAQFPQQLSLTDGEDSGCPADKKFPVGRGKKPPVPGSGDDDPLSIEDFAWMSQEPENKANLFPWVLGAGLIVTAAGSTAVIYEMNKNGLIGSWREKRAIIKDIEAIKKSNGDAREKLLADFETNKTKRKFYTIGELDNKTLTNKKFSQMLQDKDISTKSLTHNKKVLYGGAAVLAVGVATTLLSPVAQANLVEEPLETKLTRAFIAAALDFQHTLENL